MSTPAELRWAQLQSQIRSAQVALSATLALPANAPNRQLSINSLRSTIAKLQAQQVATNAIITGDALTPSEQMIISGGDYAGDVLNAGGGIIRGTTDFIAGTAGSAASKLTTPLILPMLAIAVGLYIVGKGGLKLPGIRL